MATNNATNTSNPITVAQGGTGRATLTSNAVLTGNGTGTVNMLSVGAANSVLVGTGGAPSFTTTGTVFFTGISFNSGTTILNSYVEGTFTATVTNSGSAPTVGYSFQGGRYTRIGNRVMVMYRVGLSSYTAGTGDTQLAGLPFTSNNTTNNVHVGTFGPQSVTWAASKTYYNGSIQPNTTVIDLVGYQSATAEANLAASAPGASSIFNLNMFYEV